MERSRLRALLIEDDEDDYVLTRDLLTQIDGRPIELDWAPTYELGLEGLEYGQYDVYLLDYRLGEKTGMDLLRQATAKGCKAPIIFLTGQHDYEVDVEAMRAGAADFLVKGQYSAPLLERSIRYAVERSMASEALQRAHAELEHRVEERTAALARVNEDLRKEVAERRRAEAETRQIGAALQEANEKLSRWVAELETRNREINLLREMSDLLQTCSTAEDVGMVVAQSARQLFPLASGSLCLMTSSRRVVEAVAAWGDGADLGERVFAPEDCWALRCCRPHLRLPGRDGLLCRHLAPQPPPASLCVPVMANGEALGMLHLTRAADAESAPLRESIQELAQTVSNSIGLALANLRLRETMRNQSIRDPLTGLFNRRYLEENLERELCRANRKQKPVAVLMADLDHFKIVNDSFGHDAGDAVLRAVGTLFSRGTRESDSAYRFGGEEFTLLLPEAPADVACARAEELRESVARLRLSHRELTICDLRLSFGVALFPEHGASAAEVLRAADEALYVAKSQGRNQVVVFEGRHSLEPALSAAPALLASGGER